MSSAFPIDEFKKFKNFKGKTSSGHHLNQLSVMNDMQQAVQIRTPDEISGMNGNNNNPQINNPLILMTSTQVVPVVPNIYGMPRSSSAGGQDMIQEFFCYDGQSQALVDESATQTMSHVFVESAQTQSAVANVNGVVVPVF